MMLNEIEIKLLKENIFENAHLEKSNELTRQYFKNNNLNLYDIWKSDCLKLIEFIDIEITKLNSDKTYHMIPKLKMNKRITNSKTGYFLYCRGFYFKKRNAVSFELRNNFISFCGWAAGCNRIPFIKGFVLWCDWLKKQDTKNGEDK